MHKSGINPVNHLRSGTIYQRRLACSLLLLSRLPSVVARYGSYLHLTGVRQKHVLYIGQLKQRGFVHIPRGVVPVEKLLADCDSLVQAKLKARSSELHSKKQYLIPLLSDKDRLSRRAMVDFAVSEDIVAIVSGYLYSLPFLTYLNLWYSPNRSVATLKGSQLWHLDHEALRQVKVFVYVSDVDATSGATAVFTKDYSLRRQKELGYRFDGGAKHFSAGLDTAKAHTLTGKRGDIVIIDTSSCFHRGSDGSGSPRYVCTAQYLPVYAFSKNKFADLNKLRPGPEPTYRRHLFHV